MTDPDASHAAPDANARKAAPRADSSDAALHVDASKAAPHGDASDATLRTDASNPLLLADAFEAALRADGFQEVVRRQAPPGGDPTPHAHAWDVRGLVLRGAFMVEADGQAQRCGAGEVFTLAAGRTHTEAAGPEGAELLVGRRHPGQAT